MDEIFETATSHNALELLYQKGRKEHSMGFVQNIFKKIWFGTNNSHAVSNRLIIVKKEILIGLEKLIHEGVSSISILSIASGSARAIISALSEVDVPSFCNISVTFLDKNQCALEYSKTLLKEFELNMSPQFQFHWINDTVSNYLEFESRKFDIVEMVGLLDYFDDKKAINTFSRIKHILSPSGIFITANINYNSEEKFVTNVVSWKMIYRTADELGNLLVTAGFAKSQVKLYYEPLKIHALAIVG